MMRWTHTAGAALLAAVALTAYGVKEETRALRREEAALTREAEALAARLETLEVEWRYVTSPEPLARLAERLYGSDGLRDAAGAPLEPWRPDQFLALPPAEGDAAAAPPERIEAAPR